MGTNYYLHKKETICQKCGHNSEEPLHIGKSSFGWAFALHVIPERNLNTLEDWQDLWDQPGYVIEDEYGVQKTARCMLEIVNSRKGYATNANAQPLEGCTLDSDGLLRRKVDGVHCIGHGMGSYDFIAGEFS